MMYYHNDCPCFVAADMKTGAGVYKGEPKQGKADCTLTIDDKNMVDMASGKLNGQTVSLGKKKEKSRLCRNSQLIYILFQLKFLLLILVLITYFCFL